MCASTGVCKFCFRSVFSCGILFRQTTLTHHFHKLKNKIIRKIYNKENENKSTTRSVSKWSVADNQTTIATDKCQKLCCFVCELKKYLLGFTLLGFLSRGTDTCHVGNYFLGVLSLTGTRLATVGWFGWITLNESTASVNNETSRNLIFFSLIRIRKVLKNVRRSRCTAMDVSMAIWFEIRTEDLST